MIRRFVIRLAARFAGVGRPDPEALFEELSRAHPGTGKYANAERYADFRAVFLSSEQGRRVLYEVLSWGHVYRVSPQGQPMDSHRMAFHEGERNLALKLLATINHEPSERPSRTTTTRGE